VFLAGAPEDAPFRGELRDWLANALPPLPWPQPADRMAKLPVWRRWTTATREQRGWRDTGDAADWVRLAYQAQGTAIAGAKTYIQRNFVAGRLLGVPRS
jgi:hypothetical protein